MKNGPQPPKRNPGKAEQVSDACPCQRERGRPPISDYEDSISTLQWRSLDSSPAWLNGGWPCIRWYYVGVHLDWGMVQIA